MAFMAAVTSFLYCLQRARLLSYLQDSLRGSRQIVDLPSQDEMEDDECENADKGAWREGIDQKHSCRYDPNRPDHYAHPAKALTKGRCPEHRHTEGNETYGHQEEPYTEQRVEYALSRLPHEDESRPILGGRPGSMIEVGDRGGSDMRESSSRQHAETHNAQDAPEESGREARLPQSTIQGEEVGDPQDEDHQVEAILYRARRSNVGESHDLPLGFNRLRSHERDHHNEDENKDDAAQDTGQTTPSQDAFLLIYCFHGLPPGLFGDYPLDTNLFNPSMLTLNDLFISLLLCCRLSLIQGPYSGEGCLPSVRRLKDVGSREPREQAILGEEALQDLTDIAYRLQHLIPILLLHGLADFVLLLMAQLTENALFITAAIPNRVQQPPLAHQAGELASGEL